MERWHVGEEIRLENKSNRAYFRLFLPVCAHILIDLVFFYAYIKFSCEWNLKRSYVGSLMRRKSNDEDEHEEEEEVRVKISS